LYLLLFADGGSSHGWRFDYSFEGKRKTISFGTYPDTALHLFARKPKRPARCSPEGSTRARSGRPSAPATGRRPKRRNAPRPRVPRHGAHALGRTGEDQRPPSERGLDRGAARAREGRPARKCVRPSEVQQLVVQVVSYADAPPVGGFPGVLNHPDPRWIELKSVQAPNEVGPLWRLEARALARLSRSTVPIYCNHYCGVTDLCACSVGGHRCRSADRVDPLSLQLPASLTW